ncbi:uncharacterized protein TNCV_3222261 [Trichonephila clavipes]|nr:uncharacterized protein TNCV_3222261 [Trichonephila clavipes]
MFISFEAQWLSGSASPFHNAGQINTCARVDAVFIPRYNNKSRHEVTRHVNTENPQAQSSNEVANPNAVEPEDAPTCNLERYFETMQERLDNMERRLCRICNFCTIMFLKIMHCKLLY